MLTEVTSLELLEDAQFKDLGGKAIHCWQMVRQGIAIPRSIVVPAQCYVDHVARCDVQELIAKVLKGEDMDANLAEIRSRIEAAPLDESIVAKVADFLGSLKGETRAVSARSSGSLEDLKDSSFAGQYETFLNLRTIEDAVSGIKKCWASMWKEHVLAYRAQLEELGVMPTMAVLVMHQINSKAAGVMFTRNPVTGSTDECIIEAVYGQGEGLVGGELDPDRYTYIKSKNAFVNPVIANKTHKYILNAKSDIEKVACDPSEQNVACLPDNCLLTQISTKPS
eukprot:NODE_1057_length_1683_cov_56.582262_g211_i1.p1 GENE.NODE_1057_length_1683_cov_56.582262_g211_i1~~NODE_1057_length_1683_cov_56.582262_g211_i1.p1  ORF type:complete len:281 (+),score=83.97 NODE_1057_length_1683_cov_56.582262_g211_i1:2-844(+)